MSERNPILIGQAEEVDTLLPGIRKMMETPGIYILGDTQRPELNFVLVVTAPWEARFMSPDADSVDPARFLPTVTHHGPYYANQSNAGAQPTEDTARLNWLATNPRGAEIVVDGERRPCVFWGISADPEQTLREALDAAMRTAAQQDRKVNG